MEEQPLTRYIDEMCKILSPDFEKLNVSNKNFIMDRQHGYLYCYNYKVGTTTWAMALTDMYQWNKWHNEYDAWR